jgi:hypothetical protein
MHSTRIILAIVTLLICCSQVLAETPRAFPGAMGFGSETVAGRGGRIIRVTNLESRGSGSLRAAIEADGPRIIVFEVGGIIDLDKADLRIRNPFVTVAGQTAPSPGITVIRGGMKLQTHDILMQHLRFRMGDAGLPKKYGYESDVSVESGNAWNVVIDHCSMSWGTDENLSVSGPLDQGPNNTAHRTTLSNNIIAEGLWDSAHGKGKHSMGSLIHDNVQDVAIIGNLYAHNNDRNPYMKSNTTGVVVNNFIYNPGSCAICLGGYPPEWVGREMPPPPRVSVVGNVLQYGTNTRKGLPLIRHSNTGVTADAFVEDNVALDAAGQPAAIMTDSIRTLAEKPVWPTGLQALPAAQVRESVLAHAGARPKERDDVDERIVADLRLGKGRIIDSQNDVGGYPTTQATRRALDIPATDIDGWLQRLALELE